MPPFTSFKYLPEDLRVFCFIEVTIRAYTGFGALVTCTVSQKKLDKWSGKGIVLVRVNDDLNKIIVDNIDDFDENIEYTWCNIVGNESSLYL